MYSKFASPFVWLLSFFVLLFAYSKLVGPIPFSVSSVTTVKSTTFDVSGEGRITAKPDTAVVSAGIQAQGQSIKSAQDQINTVINKVTDAIKQLGVDSKDIQTTNYSVYPSYDYGGGQQRITGYSASTNVLVKIRNLDNINKVIDTATANGANQISGVSFEVGDKDKLESEARQKAVDAAKKKAEQAASIAGFKLGRIINYSEAPQNFPRPVMQAATIDKAAGSTETQIEPGSSEIIINVTLSYEIQ